VLALAAVWFTLSGGEAIVPLLLLGYNLVTQLFPALVLSLPARPLATRVGCMSGIVTGEAIVAWSSLSGTTLAKLLPTWPSAITDLNIGIVAMSLNFAVLLTVSAATRERMPAGLGERTAATAS
jgi:SSS family solute:Na+ symporter